MNKKQEVGIKYHHLVESRTAGTRGGGQLPCATVFDDADGACWVETHFPAKNNIQVIQGYLMIHVESFKSHPANLPSSAHRFCLFVCPFMCKHMLACINSTRSRGEAVVGPR